MKVKPWASIQPITKRKNALIQVAFANCHRLGLLGSNGVAGEVDGLELLGHLVASEGRRILLDARRVCLGEGLEGLEHDVRGDVRE